MNVSEKYELINRRNVKELASEGYLLRHKKTGARVFILENDDDNKVFYIGFRTPPTDSTGVAHIMEHSVLCGSKSFPAKDPFVELAKGSLNTFLNAMTYPDKTVYPVASCNDKDFKNLMHVYMDAVFHPNIYTRPQIFAQEGWHYEMEEPEGDITINGVVYNEMKGVFSSPEDVVERQVYQMLYPDTAYSYESGGDPECIPELTRDDFISFHKRYYHPSNSYIYLYGNCDMEERLEWLDSEYLSDYEEQAIDSTLSFQEPFDAPREKEIEYGITEEDDTEDNTYLACNWVIDTALNRELYLAFQILDYTLLSAPGAPVTEKLLRSGIGKDVMSSYENGILQPFFSIMVKNANGEDKDRFLKIIRETLEEIAEKGIDRMSLLAGINFFDFKYREADFGQYPKGLMYGLQCLDSWLYDEKDPYMHISAVETIEFLKSQVETGYFEELIKKYLLGNPHEAILVAKPVKGLTGKKDADLAEKLDSYKKTLSDEEKAGIIKETKELKRYQEEPSTQEELMTIPLLAISDIEKKARPIENEILNEDGVEYVLHEINTNGIGYLTVLFGMDSLPDELLPMAGLVKNLLMMVSTEKYSYFELSNEINARTGGMSVGIDIFNGPEGESDFRSYFSIDSKYLEGAADFVFEMFEEVLLHSSFDDETRIKELLLMLVSRFQMTMMSSGNAVAVSRACSYFSPAAALSEKLQGYDFYREVLRVSELYEKDPGAVRADMIKTLSHMIRRGRIIVDFTGSRNEFEKIKEKVKDFVQALPGDLEEAAPRSYEKESRNEGFKSSSQVQYVAMAGDYRKAGLDYNGSLRVLRTILGYDFLWINVRVKGGAYGCMNNFARAGRGYFVSYRDPALRETCEVYRQIADYLESFNAEERDMRKYIIGTISTMDTPLTPRMRGTRSFNLYMTGLSEADVQKERDEVLATDVSKVRSLAPYARAIVDQDNICVIGAEEKIQKEKDLFKTVRNLF